MLRGFSPTPSQGTSVPLDSPPPLGTRISLDGLRSRHVPRPPPRPSPGLLAGKGNWQREVGLHLDANRTAPPSMEVQETSENLRDFVEINRNEMGNLCEGLLE